MIIELREEAVITYLNEKTNHIISPYIGEYRSYLYCAKCGKIGSIQGRPKLEGNELPMHKKCREAMMKGQG